MKHFSARACNCFFSPLLLQTIIRKQGNNIFQVGFLCLFFWRELFALSHLKLLLSYFPFPQFVLATTLAWDCFFFSIFHFKLNEIILMIFVNRKWVTAIQRGCWTSLCSRPPLLSHKLKLGWSISREGHHTKNGTHYQLCGDLLLPPAAAVRINQWSSAKRARSQRVWMEPSVPGPPVRVAQCWHFTSIRQGQWLLREDQEAG